MMSTLCQKLLTILGQKAQNFVWFGLYEFVKISTACGPNTLIPKCIERLKTSNVTISNGNIKCPIEKSTLAVILPLKRFRATVANADIIIIKSLHTFL